MADTLRIKRRTSGGPGAPSALLNAEIAYNEVNDTLYYGKGDSGGNATSIIAIGGPGAFPTVPVTVAQGGTALTTYAQGDILYASAANTLAKLAKDANATRYLSNTGASNNPAWGQINLANGVTGTLPLANGGSGGTTAATAPWTIRAGDTMTGNLTIATAAPIFTLNKAASGTDNLIYGATAGVNRWVVDLGNNTAESGSNAGSDFIIARYSDTGAYLGTPLLISRATGNLSLTGTTSNFYRADAQFFQNAAATYSMFVLTANTWDFYSTNPTLLLRMSASVYTAAPSIRLDGSNIVINAKSGGKVYLAYDVATDTYFGGSMYAQHIACQADNTYQCGISGSNCWWGVGSYRWNTASDRRLKDDFADLPDCLDLVRTIKPQRFRWKNEPEDGVHWGFVAQDVGAAMQAAGHEFAGHRHGKDRTDTLDYQQLIAVLWQAVTELTAQVEALKR